MALIDQVGGYNGEILKEFLEVGHQPDGRSAMPGLARSAQVMRSPIAT